VVGSVWCIATKKLIAFALTISSIIAGLIILVAVNNSLNRMRANQPKYYAVQEIGSVESPVTIAVVDGTTFNITEQLHVVLYNPELYYLEVQSYSMVCDGWCLIDMKKAPSYSVVQRSLVEVQ